MTAYDPHDPDFTDEAAVRSELTRVFDVCQGCRRCVDLCGSFPTLFDLVDRFDDRGAGNLTPAEQDQVVDACFHCKLCAVDCPYAPGRHEQRIDVPRLMVRANAMRVSNGQVSPRRQLATRLVARTSVFGQPGRLARLFERVASAVGGAHFGVVLASTFGMRSTPELPPRARRRWSEWFDRRSPRPAVEPEHTVIVFPTCVVEHRDVAVGQHLVEVYERNGIACERTSAGCCGAPWLHAGHVSRFIAVAHANVETLAGELRDRDADIVVPGPTCSYVLRHEYPVYVDDEHRADADLVAGRTADASEYLMRLHHEDDHPLDTGFHGAVPGAIRYHAADHVRAQQIGLPAQELMELTGARVDAAPVRPGMVSDVSVSDDVDDAPADASDAGLIDPALAQRPDSAPLHPLSVVARAYGIDRP